MLEITRAAGFVPTLDMYTIEVHRDFIRLKVVSIDRSLVRLVDVHLIPSVQKAVGVIQKFHAITIQLKNHSVPCTVLHCPATVQCVHVLRYSACSVLSV